MQKAPVTERLLSLDRRWIFLLVLIFALGALVIEVDLPIVASQPVQDMYDQIERLQKLEASRASIPAEQQAALRSTLLISMDYDPASKPELEPMSLGIITHALCNGVKVVGMTLNQHGQDLGERVMQRAAKACNADYGRDWAYLGFKPGGATLIINMGQDFHDAYNQDYRGTSTKSLEVTRNITSLNSFGYVVSVASSVFWEQWVIFGQARYNFVYGTGVAGVLAPDVFPFMQTGQVKGLLGGLVGAAEFESLIKRPGTATAGMRPQSAVHLLIVLLVIFGNTMYFLDRRRKRRSMRPGGGS